MRTLMIMARRFEPRAATAKSLLAALIVSALLCVDADAQRRPRAEQREAGAAKKEKPSPRFADYPVREVYRGRVAPVVITGKRERMFRTRLREDSRGGPNFAGHYTVVFWGCGTGCAQVAVVDARTGRVYWPPLDYVDIPPEADPEVRNRTFRLDSRLLVLTRSLYDGRGSYTAYYYLFDNNRFRLIRQAEERHPDTEDSQP